MRAPVKLAAASLFATLTLAAPSQAAVIIQSTSFARAPHAEVIQEQQPGPRSFDDLDRTGTQETLIHFNGFDQSLGTLTGVRLQLVSRQDFGTGLSIVGTGSAKLSDGDYWSSVQLAGQAVGGLTSGFDLLDYEIPCLTHDDPFCIGSERFRQGFDFDVAAADLSPFLAAGGVDLGLKSTIDLSAYIYAVTANSIFTASGELNWDGDLSVTYTYAPAIALPPASLVPEPATWAMLTMGFGLSGAALRRRRRATLARPV